MNVIRVCNAAMKETKSQGQFCIHCYSKEWNLGCGLYYQEELFTESSSHIQDGAFFSSPMFITSFLLRPTMSQFVKILVSSCFVFMYSAFKNNKTTHQAFAQVCDAYSFSTRACLPGENVT